MLLSCVQNAIHNGLGFLESLRHIFRVIVELPTVRGIVSQSRYGFKTLGLHIR